MNIWGLEVSCDNRQIFNRSAKRVQTVTIDGGKMAVMCIAIDGLNIAVCEMSCFMCDLIHFVDWLCGRFVCRSDGFSSLAIAYATHHRRHINHHKAINLTERELRRPEMLRYQQRPDQRGRISDACFMARAGKHEPPPPRRHRTFFLTTTQTLSAKKN